jgi:hypothetical protein
VAAPSSYRPTLILLAGVLPAVLLAITLTVNLAIFLARAEDRGHTSTLTTTSVKPSASPTAREPGAEDCAAKEGGHFILASCSAPSMKVLAAADYTADAAEVCPDPTDEFGHTRSNDVLCLQHLSNDHPGAAGRGGGVLRAGDCLGDVDVNGFTEVACGGPKAFHKIVALTPEAKYCPAGSVRALERSQAPGPKAVVCGADAGGIAGPGECVAWSSGDTAFTDAPVPCSQRPAAKFTGRATTSKGCARWASASGYYYTVERSDAIGPMKFNCYVKLG